MAMPERTVLIIEDENNSIGIPPVFFSEAGYRVETSRRAAEGIERCRLLKPGVVVLDMLMPDMPGDETIRELSQHTDTADIPVIVTLPPGFYPSGMAELKRMGRRVEVLKRPIDLRDLKKLIGAMAEDGGGR